MLEPAMSELCWRDALRSKSGLEGAVEVLVVAAVVRPGRSACVGGLDGAGESDEEDVEDCEDVDRAGETDRDDVADGRVRTVCEEATLKPSDKWMEDIPAVDVRARRRAGSMRGVRGACS